MRNLTTPLCLTLSVLLGLIFIFTAPSDALAGKWKTVNQDESPVILKDWPSDINWRFRDGGSRVDYSQDRWAVFGHIVYGEMKNRTYIKVNYLNPGYYWGRGFQDDIREDYWFNTKKGWFQKFTDAKWESGQLFECSYDVRCSFRNLKFTVENETCQWVLDIPDLHTTDGSSGRSAEP